MAASHKTLPATPDLEYHKKQAKRLRKSHQAGDPKAIERIREFHPVYLHSSENDILAGKFSLRDAQLVIAREYGIASWPKLKKHIESLSTPDTSRKVRASVTLTSKELDQFREIAKAKGMTFSNLVRQSLWQKLVREEIGSEEEVSQNKIRKFLESFCYRT